MTSRRWAGRRDRNVPCRRATLPSLTAMTPEEALARIVHCLDRAHVGGFKTKAWSGALARVRETDPDDLAGRAQNQTLAELPGIGEASARAITEALAGETPSYLVKLEAETEVPITPEG